MMAVVLALGMWLLHGVATRDAVGTEPSAPSGTQTAADSSGATDAAPKPEAATRALSVHTIRIKTQDGAILEADEFAPSGGEPPAAGLVLLHGFGETRRAWGDFPATLARTGYRVLAIDLRGHGGSSTFIGEPDRIQEDPDIGPSDLRAALTYLRAAPGIDASRIGVIGAELGGDLAGVASGLKMTRTAVALSPQSEKAHLLARPRYLSMRSLLLIAASGDPEQEADARRLYMEARPPKDIQVLAGNDGGETILRGHPDTVAMILDWLDQNL